PDDKLERWLERVHARHLWEAAVPGATLHAYLINARVALVLHHAGGCGWEMFVPASQSVDIARTLDDAALALDTEGCAGL
ncbi:MAG TPA: hypothetical protein VKD72_08635, partial [Gemmataceae bacterium]|nr:hypothetical protein [Gemmataceae bacterium]